MSYLTPLPPLPHESTRRKAPLAGGTGIGQWAVGNGQWTVDMGGGQERVANWQ
jgi:hypothetical protein